MRGRGAGDDLPLIVEEILSTRWNIKILRVLATGPARFSGIKDAIPSISANLLAGRLRHLENVGIVQKMTLPPPASCQVYALTEIGEGSRPVLQAVTHWASLFPREPVR